MPNITELLRALRQPFNEIDLQQATAEAKPILSNVDDQEICLAVCID